MTEKKSKIIISVIVMLIVFVSGCTDNSINRNLDFSAGLNKWEIAHSSNVEDAWNISVIQKDDSYKNVLDFWRDNSASDGGAVRVKQKLDFDVSKKQLLILEADVKVISHTLDGSGWWYDTHPGEGDYPVHIFLIYNDTTGKQQVWSWGFLTGSNPNTKTNYDIVNASEWYHFTSQNLMELVPRPEIITNIYVGGSGWDFQGRIDNTKIIAS
ncbi:TPA: hypothetical protein H1005_01290 [archaeon]|uniref:Uncharacterized protein n=1 Tax=Candidatus Naiadarchaeum limnaeum TaxID=2756139 RepID=A0A832V155_9ARCH|nr:hypothetical protein [Candidatus Naiadarchaeales archaeon SRR2090153.bin1042]HIK00298.1 hypothetical protein [Candidatus Naiadarchaeum limnaeum]